MAAALRIAAVVLGGLVAFCSALPAQARAAGPAGDQRALFDATNRERTARHLPALQWDENLAHAAYDHALWMARVRAISHQFPGESGLSARILRVGVHSSLVAENVGNASNAAELHAAWMSSSGHRANLLEPQANVVGIAVVESGGLIYAVEDFARTIASLSFKEQERQVGAQLAAHGLRLLDTTSSVRQTCALSRGVARGQHPKFLFRYLTVDLAVLPAELLDELKAHPGQYHSAAVGACPASDTNGFDGYRFAVLLY